MLIGGIGGALGECDGQVDLCLVILDDGAALFGVEIDKSWQDGMIWDLHSNLVEEGELNKN